MFEDNWCTECDIPLKHPTASGKCYRCLTGSIYVEHDDDKTQRQGRVRNNCKKASTKSTEELMLSTADVAKIFHVCTSTVATWARGGWLPSYRSRYPTLSYRFKQEDVDQFIPPVIDTLTVITPADVIKAPEQSMMTTKEAAITLGLGASTVARMAQHGRIKAYLVLTPVKKYYFKRSDIEQLTISPSS